MAHPDPPYPDDSFSSQALVPLRLVRVVLRERSDQQWIFLAEVSPAKEGNERGFPIVIGTGEAAEIHRLVSGVTPPRPLTHQLTATVVESLGSRVLGVDIVDLRSNTFYAQLRLAVPGTDGSLSQEVSVDARPSDALAIALRSGAPIRVAETVLEQVRSDKAQDVLEDPDDPTAEGLGEETDEIDGSSDEESGDDDLEEGDPGATFEFDE